VAVTCSMQGLKVQRWIGTLGLRGDMKGAVDSSVGVSVSEGADVSAESEEPELATSLAVRAGRR
jgi:hypothetical protein